MWYRWRLQEVSTQQHGIQKKQQIKNITQQRLTQTE